MKNKTGEYDLNFTELSGMFIWVAGVVVAKAGWSTFFAIVFPPWAWYLLIQHLFLLWEVV